MTDFIISDLHVPYHDVSALDVVLKMYRHYKPKNVIFNGDMLDCPSVSRFNKEPQEPQALKQQIDAWCAIIPKFQRHSKVTYIEGNHEARIQKYINSEAPALDGLLSIEELINTRLKKRITYIRTTPGESMMSWGIDDDILVGHFNKAAKNTCYTAKLLVEKYMTNVVQAHTHRLGQYALRGYGYTYRGFEGGCLCNLDPGYVAKPNWQQGFLVYSEVGNRWNIESVTIHGGAALFRGKMFGKGDEHHG